MHTSASASTQVAVLGGGCFWGVEHGLASIPGVVATEVGYAGGTTESPTYASVCSGMTGHAEVVRVTFDPARLSFHALLTAFFDLHDPTAFHRQGPDIGSQYRSIVVCQSDAQRAAAHAFIREWSQQHPGSLVVTEVVDAMPFTRAEEYHQQYVARRGLSSCHVRS